MPALDDLSEQPVPLIDETLAALEPPRESVVQEDQVVEGELQRGQTLSHLLSQNEVAEDEIRQAVEALRALIDLRKLQPGHAYRLELDPEGRFKRLRYTLSRETQYVVEAGREGFTARQELIEVSRVKTLITGEVRSSLFESIVSQGHSSAIAMKLIEAFQWDINFYTDVQEGDRYQVLAEQLFIDGHFERIDRVLVARYEGSSVGTKEAYFFEGDYYNAAGTSLQRSFLTTPLSVMRVTSRFGQRFHPVLKISRPHRGVDYGAARGTPVWSVADGRVLYAGNKGDGYGRQVIIEHAGGYTSRYAHLHRVSVKKGQTVGQKRKIGEVGSSGMATGPHLHFEVLSRGKPINPARMKMLPGEERRVKDMDGFVAERERLTGLLNETLVASSASPAIQGLD